MGKQKVKAIVLTALQNALTTAQALQSGLGFLPIGGYKGTLDFWDLDKANNQPLVNAERLHILGVLDGRLAAYDLLTLPIPAGQALGSVLRARLTVPAGVVFFVQDIRVVDAGDAAATLNTNFRCSLWPDNIATPPDADGQTFWAVDQAKAGGQTTDALFGVLPTAGSEDKPVVLRLPGGAVVTLQVTVAVAAVKAATSVTLSLFGYVGKWLVDKPSPI